MKKGNPVALLPILVFLVLYLGLGIILEYVLGIEMGFYNIPIVVVFLIALAVACVQNRKMSLDDKIIAMGEGVGTKTIIYMILIFMAAGIFVGVVGRGSAESCAYWLLSIVPAEYAIGVMFVVACFVSISMGTSVGTITLLTPIGFAISQATGFSLPLCVGTIMGGAMFGDNLSFISDTTIAACIGQDCQMSDKFKENFKIALPAAIVTLIIVMALSFNSGITGTIDEPYSLIQIIPYLLVFIGGIAGINVFIVLIIGIVSGAIIMLATGATAPLDLMANMGSGAAGMFETTMVAILVSCIGALVRAYGGFDALMYALCKVFKGRKAGQLGMGLLVGCMEIATANNTVAIVIANPIATDMAHHYGISRRKTASILDTFSCVFQGILPYGAQMLVAISAVVTLGGAVSAFQILPCLIYPFALCISCLLFIFIIPDKKEQQRAAAEAAEYEQPRAAETAEYAQQQTGEVEHASGNETE